MTQQLDLTAQFTRRLVPIRVSDQIANGVDIAVAQAGFRKQSEYVRALILADLKERGILSQEVSIEKQTEN